MTDTHIQINGLRVALEMERRGKNLYVRAQQFTEDPDLIELLKSLAMDETKHHAQFSAMLEVFNIPQMNEEENVLAAAKAADFFFPGGLMQAAMDGALESCEAMLDDAMQAERDSIAFYGRLLSYVMDEEMQDIILRIMREEMTHLRNLTEKKAHYLKHKEVGI